MRFFWALMVLAIVSFGDLLVFNGRHLQGVNNVAHRFAVEAQWKMKRALSTLRI